MAFYSERYGALRYEVLPENAYDIYNWRSFWADGNKAQRSVKIGDATVSFLPRGLVKLENPAIPNDVNLNRVFDPAVEQKGTCTGFHLDGPNRRHAALLHPFNGWGTQVDLYNEDIRPFYPFATYVFGKNRQATGMWRRCWLRFNGQMPAFSPVTRVPSNLRDIQVKRHLRLQDENYVGQYGEFYLNDDGKFYFGDDPFEFVGEYAEHFTFDSERSITSRIELQKYENGRVIEAFNLPLHFPFEGQQSELPFNIFIFDDESETWSVHATQE